MADRLIQDYLSSGEASEIKIGGITDGKKVVLTEEIPDYADVRRKTLTPSKLVTYLPEGTPFTTPSIGNTPTKILIPTTVKSIQDFALQDLGAGNLAYTYTGTDTISLAVNMHSGMQTGTNNIVVKFDTYKNGVKEPGLSATRKVGTGSDVGAFGITGEITLSTNDYIELYITNDNASTVTFIETSINICERN